MPTTDTNTNTSVATTTVQTSYPVAKKVAERATLDASKLTWQAHKAQLIKDGVLAKDAPLDVVKQHQAEYTKLRDEKVRQIKAAGTAIINDARFGRAKLQTWTDSAGNQNYLVRGSDKSYAVKSKEGKVDVQAAVAKALADAKAAQKAKMLAAGISEADADAMLA